MPSWAGGPLVGRVRELAVVDGLVAGLRAGRGGLAWFEGVPGIGKSALVTELASRAKAAGCATLVAAGDELGKAFPLRLMAECLGVSVASADPVRVEVARLLRADPGGPGAFDPVAAARERMLELVDRLCAAGPVVLVLEDLHWADEASQALWNRLARSVDQIPLLVVGSCRPVALGGVVDQLRLTVQERGGAVVELGPLSLVESVGLAGVVVGSVPGPRLTVELGRAGGNPLYVRELVEALARDGLVEVGDGVAELSVGGGVMPRSLVAAIGRRLAFLSEGLRRALRLAALLGAEFEVAEWVEVGGLGVAGLAELVDEAVACGVLVSVGRSLAFRHDLIRQVLVEQTPPAVRDELHRHLARVLADAGQGIDRVARHLLAVPTVDRWALEWLAGAPEGMVQAAPQATAQLLERTLALLRRDHPWWEVLTGRYAQVQFWLGRDEGALEAAGGLLARGSVDGELGARIRVEAIRAAGRLGHFEQALVLADPAGDPPGLAPHWRARMTGWSANALSYLGRTAEALETAAHAVELARACGDPVSVGIGYMVSCWLDPLGYQGQVADAIAALGDDPEPADLRVLLYSRYLDTLGRSAQWDSYDRVAVEALAAAERLGTVRAAWIPMALAETCYLRGQWDEALRHISTTPPEYTEGPTEDIHNLAAVIALRRGQSELAHSQLRGCDAAEGDYEPHKTSSMAPYLYVALALRAEAAGDATRALQLWDAWLDVPTRRGDFCGVIAPHLVRAALNTGDRATAQAAITHCAPDVGQPMLEQVLAGHLGQAMLEDNATDLLTIADAAGGHGWLPMQALALEEAAVRLAEQGHTPQAKNTFTQAIKLYADLGALHDIRRTDGRLRPHGIRRGPRSLHRRTTHGWQALTPSEQRVATLVAQGLSNPDIAAQLFLARTTVQTHVSTILNKLSLHSRIELIRHYTTITSSPQT